MTPIAAWVVVPCRYASPPGRPPVNSCFETYESMHNYSTDVWWTYRCGHSRESVRPMAAAEAAAKDRPKTFTRNVVHLFGRKPGALRNGKG